MHGVPFLEKNAVNGLSFVRPAVNDASVWPHRVTQQPDLLGSACGHRLFLLCFLSLTLSLVSDASHRRGPVWLQAPPSLFPLGSLSNPLCHLPRCAFPGFDPCLPTRDSLPVFQNPAWSKDLVFESDYFGSTRLLSPGPCGSALFLSFYTR